MSTLPTFPELSTTNQHQRWTKKEDQALTWAWQAGAPDEDMATYFNRSIQAVKMRASTIGLGRRKQGPKPEVITLEDVAARAHNAELKGKVEKITTVFDTAIELFKNMNLELKNDL